MPRSSCTGKLVYDPEIKKTARRLRQETKQQLEETSAPYEDKEDPTFEFEESLSESEEEIMALILERSINDMTSPDLNQQPLCIEYPDLEVDFKLKSGLIHLLPTFRGLAGEDPHKHLKEFHVVCFGMRPQGISEEQVKLRAFPFSLADQAKDWLYFLPSGSITRWNDLKRQFLEKYFPASRATTIRKEISAIRQFAGESLFEYWERFNRLVESFPHHQIPNHLLIQYFYEGLSNMDRKLVDAASGGALFDKTPTEAHTYQQVKACGICTLTGHATDMCPTLQESTTEHADAVGGFAGQQQRRYDPFSNTYNPGWRDHPNLNYGNQHFQKPQYRPPQQPNPTPNTSLEDMMKALVTNTQQFQQQTQASFQQFQQQTQQFQQQTQMSIQNLESQISQLASSVGKLESQELQEYVNEDDTKCGLVVKRKSEKEIEVQQEQTKHEVDHPQPLVTRPPFPERFTKAKKEEEEKEILETFRKVEINIPLLDAIKQIPRYAKFLKELCTNKGKLKGNERVSMGENVSAILQ
ncbi:uncharacterized protein LOC105164442 [Sesamum indicum]|uniref:Uncharacterized protein LOC105164442 n=1 Tax=Sesamum indicum TaxID=4182 RepID=A0A8M8V0I6_SESIN|nr:uncharacterized protein LOC105164442 [Sesamum indicum]